MRSKVDEILRRIGEDRVEGAVSLALRGLDAIEARAATLPDDPAAACRELAILAARIDCLRPSIGAIGAQAVLAVSRSKALMNEGMSPEAAVQEAVGRERETLGQANVAIAELALRELGMGGTLLTCSNSMTVRQCLVSLRPKLVIIGEGRPLDDGARAASWLQARDLEVQVVADDALPGEVARCRAVIVGADQILSGGQLINRASTLDLARAARARRVPFLVACQRVKLAGAEGAVLEEYEGRFDGAAPERSGSVVLFDLTPPELIDGVLTEVGRLSAAEAGALGARMRVLRAENAAEAVRP